MRRIRWILPAAAVVGLFLPGPAAAQSDVSVQFRHAPPGASEGEARQLTPITGTVLTGTWKVVVDASASSSLRTFTLRISPTEPNIPKPADGTWTRTYSLGEKSSDTISVEWDTNALTRHNGVYRLEASAQSHLGAELTVSVGDLKVNNTPLVPAGLTPRVEENAVKVSWKANPEPDIQGYRLYRSVDGGSYSLLSTVPGTSFTDAGPPKDKSLRYRLAAIRRSPLSEDGVSSPLSAPTSALAIASPTTTTARAPLPAVAPVELPGSARSEQILLPRRDTGFAPTLSYSGTLVPETGEAGAGGPAIGPPSLSTRVVTRSSGVVSETVSKLPFGSAAVFLVVAALHLLRFSRRLFTLAH